MVELRILHCCNLRHIESAHGLYDLLSIVDQCKDLVDFFWSWRQVLATVFRDKKVIYISLVNNRTWFLVVLTLNPHTANIPVLVQHLLVDVLFVLLVLQVRLDDELAEVDLSHVSSRLPSPPPSSPQSPFP